MSERDDTQKVEPLDAETERRLREYLWASHGHQGLYGDDGELQCGLCRPVYDYRRAPLADVVRQALTARRDVNLAFLASCPPSTGSHEEKKKEQQK